MKRCKFCGGELHDDKVSVNTRWRDRMIEVNNIEASVCSSCGETYITPDMARSLDNLSRPVDREEFLKHPDRFIDTSDFSLRNGD